jgi:hypothetical protein
MSEGNARRSARSSANVAPKRVDAFHDKLMMVTDRAEQIVL